jgi:hypothetical protein
VTTTITHALAEQSEAETLYDVETGAPAATKAGLGMASIRVGGGVAVSVRDDPTGYWSKALGFGFGEPVTAALIDEIGDFYRSQKTPMAVLQLAPSVLPGDWAGICAKANLSAAGSWVKLARDLSAGQGRPPAQLGADLRTGRIEAGHAREMASIMLRAFGMPEQHLSGMLAAVVGRPGWRARHLGRDGTGQRRADAHSPEHRTVLRRGHLAARAGQGGAVGAAHRARPGRAVGRLPLADRRDRCGGPRHTQFLAAQPAPQRLHRHVRTPELDLAARRPEPLKPDTSAT